MVVQAKYILKKELPNLKAGVIFEHREWDKRIPERGNPGSGVMILGWIDGMCQDSWCGETYMFPGQLAGNEEWFEKVHDERSLIIDKIEKWQNRLDKLDSE